MSEAEALRRALDECRQHHADTLAGLDPHTGPAPLATELSPERIGPNRLAQILGVKIDVLHDQWIDSAMSATFGEYLEPTLREYIWKGFDAGVMAADADSGEPMVAS